MLCHLVMNLEDLLQATENRIKRKRIVHSAANP